MCAYVFVVQITYLHSLLTCACVSAFTRAYINERATILCECVNTHTYTVNVIERKMYDSFTLRTKSRVSIKLYLFLLFIFQIDKEKIEISAQKYFGTTNLYKILEIGSNAKISEGIFIDTSIFH